MFKKGKKLVSRILTPNHTGFVRFSKVDILVFYSQSVSKYDEKQRSRSLPTTLTVTGPYRPIEVCMCITGQVESGVYKIFIGERFTVTSQICRLPNWCTCRDRVHSYHTSGGNMVKGKEIECTHQSRDVSCLNKHGRL